MMEVKSEANVIYPGDIRYFLEKFLNDPSEMHLRQTLTLMHGMLHKIPLSALLSSDSTLGY